MLFDILAQDASLFLAAISKRDIPVPPGKAGKLHENVIQEERQPNAFATAVKSDQIHSIIPVPCAHQWKAMFAESQTMQDRAHAMVIQARNLFGARGKIVIRIFIRADLPSFQERNRLIQHARIAGGGNIAADRQRQPVLSPHAHPLFQPLRPALARRQSL